MSRTLLLLRHAKSAWSDPRLDDHDRPLNRRGERAAKAMADHFAQLGLRPDLILCSTALRTRQTLAPIMATLAAPAPLINLSKDLYLASEDVLLSELQAVSDDATTVLLIGHNDGIWHFATGLAHDGPPAELAALRDKFPTGALATLSLRDEPWRTVGFGAARLVSFLRPRDLGVV
ncbi:SixA phosphatase family protein [Reyranella sp.]|uniref:SixA phosphatase family protein n=1 Tax=Reyranella sp. TaxID=1929291 RepID=UPI00378406A6